MRFVHGEKTTLAVVILLYTDREQEKRHGSPLAKKTKKPGNAPKPDEMVCTRPSCVPKSSHDKYIAR